jgi:protein-S-isoprenylcysteine O-methyltransferase Ste14
MSTLSDWMVVAGFLLAAFGVALRVFIMMRSSDTRSVNVSPNASRNLMRDYSSAFPTSSLPVAMRISLYAGVLLLIAGLLLEFR